MQLPKGWFGPKTIGYGASPRGWGWLVTALWLAVLIGLVRVAAPDLAIVTGWPRGLVTLGLSLGWIALLL